MNSDISEHDDLLVVKRLERSVIRLHSFIVLIKIHRVRFAIQKLRSEILFSMVSYLPHSRTRDVSAEGGTNLLTWEYLSKCQRYT